MPKSTPSMQYFEIALPRHVFSTFTYNYDKPIAVGARVEVPFGKRHEFGVVVDISDKPSGDFVCKNILRILDDAPIVSESLLKFLKYIARYYQYPLGEVLQVALPNLLVHGEANIPDKDIIYSITQKGTKLLTSRLGVKQHSVLKALKNQTYNETELCEKFSISKPWLADLVKREWITGKTILKKSFPVAKEKSPIPQLSEEQQQVVTALNNCRGFSVEVIDGVTGSGKTEVYLRWLMRLLQSTEQVLLLVPEIGIAQMLYQRLSKRLMTSVGLFHSGMTDIARLKTWQAVKSGEIKLLIGTRSALFAPFIHLAGIIVDEAHDLGYKQKDTLRYQAVDMACVRAKMENIPIILGSATHSVETYANIESGKWRRHLLTQRIRAQAVADVVIDDLRQSNNIGGLSILLIKEMRSQIAAGQQVMLFLNRRGYAPILRCTECGWESECTACSSRMTAHIQSRQLICHHCGRHGNLPTRCPKCLKASLEMLGLGTQRLEQTIREQFPKARVLRIDTDNFTTAKQFEQAVLQIQNREVDIILGTQWLSKGHHFPGITLVGVVDCDSAFYSNDYRAEERLAQLLVQVGGRAGRESKGMIWVQTKEPEHPVFNALKTPYQQTAKRLLKLRKESLLPPYSVQVQLFARHGEESRAIQTLKFTRDGVIAAGIDANILWFGPAPATMLRKDGFVRVQILLQTEKRQVMQKALPAINQWLIAQGKALNVKVGMDVDPLWQE